MKTTIEIADPLLKEAKKAAAREGTTLRALVERGLRHVVTEKKKRRRTFKMPTFDGGGLNPEFRKADGTEDWEKIYEEIYRGRGT
jgi:hypothetical protein